MRFRRACVRARTALRQSCFVTFTSDTLAADAGGRRAVGAGLFLLSTALLTLEILQTRLLAYCFAPLLIYTAIGLALLGLGAAASALTLWQGWRRWRLGTIGAFGAGAFAASAIAAHRVLAKFSPQIIDLADITMPGLLRADLIAVCAALSVPYFFAGLAITACLASSRREVHGAYFLNLLGSAAGCFGVAVLLQPLGAPVLLGAVAAFAALAGLVFLRDGAHPIAGAAAGAGLMLALTAVWRPHMFFPFRPDPSGQLAVLQAQWNEAPGRPQYYTVWESWDVTGHVGFHELPDVPALVPEPVRCLWYAQDGSAGSVVFGVNDNPAVIGPFFARTIYGAAHEARGQGGARVLVIGLGGGPDVMCAHHYGAAHVTGVDINGSAIAALRGPLREFAGNPYDRDNVVTVRMDGRSFVRSSRDSFDLIVMSGADTKSVHAAGSLAISENNLYTVEAFCDYLARLTDDGLLAVSRFGRYDRLKLTSIAIAALRRAGAEHPDRHFAVLEQGAWTTLLVGKQPIAAERIDRLRAWLAGIPEETGIFIPHLDPIGFGFGTRPVLLWPQGEQESPSDVAPLLAAAATGTEHEYLAARPLNLDPTTDDRPFFFDQQKRADVLRSPKGAYRVLGKLLLVLAGLALVFIVLPVPVLRRTAPDAGLLRSLAYFSALGFGFMLLEIGLMQKLSLFLGHQSYAITVVLASLLLGAGLGSATAGALGLGRGIVRFVAIPLLIAAGAALWWALDRYGAEYAAWPLSQRVALTGLSLLPLGFLLGMPFPTALSLSPRSVLPWGIAANGFMSVLGASAALPMAMLVGYRAMLIAAGACYLVALLVFPRPAPPVADVVEFDD